MSPAAPVSPQAPSKVVGHYRILSCVGKGGFGEALLVEDTSGKHSGNLIAKRIELGNLNEKAKDSAMNEVQLLAKLSAHPFVVKYYEAFVYKSSLYVIMDYCTSDLSHQMDLKRRSGSCLTEEQVLKYFSQIAAAVHHMHGVHILHRDLKLCNVLLDRNGRVRVSDFGISKSLSAGMAHTRTGTITHMGPEILKGEPYSYPADMWALGCILYELITFEAPFNGSSVQSIMRAVQTKPTPKLPSRISEPVRAVCYALLSKNPADRPTARELMNHPKLQESIARLAMNCKQGS